MLAAASLAEASALLAAHGDVDVALVDLFLDGESGVDAIRALSERGVASIALTNADDAELVFAALGAGASGYLLKDDPLDRILSALQEVARGRMPLSSGVTHHLISAACPPPADVRLTAREHDVLVALARGLTYRECASTLGLTLGTIQTYVKQIYQKLDVTTKTEACAWAIRYGIVT